MNLINVDVRLPIQGPLETEDSPVEMDSYRSKNDIIETVKNNTRVLQPEGLFQLVKDLTLMLEDQQKIALLDQLSQIVKLGHLASLRFSARLHTACTTLVDCYDFVAWLPPELVLNIFMYLPWESLVACSLVNRAWFQAARNQELYRRLCQSNDWFPLDPENTETTNKGCPSEPDSSIYTCDSLDGDRVDWYSVFKKRSRLRTNWVRGKYRMRRFQGHSEVIYCLAYDGYRIVSGSADATIRVWSVCTNADWSVQTLRGHSEAVRCLQLLPLTSSPNGRVPQDNWSKFWQPPEAVLISGSTDSTIKLWHLSTNLKWSRIACTSTLQGHTDAVRCIKADNQNVISGSYDCTVRLWSIESNRVQRIFRGHAAGVVCLTYDDVLLYSGSLDNTVRVWCISSGVCLFILRRSHPFPNSQFWLTPVSSILLDVPRNRLLIAHHDGLIMSWPIPPTTHSNDSHGNCTSVRRRLVCDSQTIFLTERFSKDEVTSGEIVRCIDGDKWHIVCGSDDKTLRIWRASDNQLINVLHGHEDGVTCVAVTSSAVISGSYDKTILLYDFDIT